MEIRKQTEQEREQVEHPTAKNKNTGLLKSDLIS